jgi:small subunit ribosomal protein S19
MTRSVWKGPFLDPSMYSVLFDAMGLPLSHTGSHTGSHAGETQALLSKGAKPIVCWSRRSSVTPEHINMHLRVHNGKTFIRLLVTEDMVGHKFGEFAMTRKRAIHKKKTKKK